jgi:hypothetical protein
VRDSGLPPFTSANPSLFWVIGQIGGSSGRLGSLSPVHPAIYMLCCVSLNHLVHTPNPEPRRFPVRHGATVVCRVPHTLFFIFAFCQCRELPCDNVQSSPRFQSWLFQLFQQLQLFHRNRSNRWRCQVTPPFICNFI